MPFKPWEKLKNKKWNDASELHGALKELRQQFTRGELSYEMLEEALDKVVGFYIEQRQLTKQEVYRILAGLWPLKGVKAANPKQDLLEAVFKGQVEAKGRNQLEIALVIPVDIFFLHRLGKTVGYVFYLPKPEVDIAEVNARLEKRLEEEKRKLDRERAKKSEELMLQAEQAQLKLLHDATKAKAEREMLNSALRAKELKVKEEQESQKLEVLHQGELEKIHERQARLEQEADALAFNRDYLEEAKKKSLALYRSQYPTIAERLERGLQDIQTQQRQVEQSLLDNQQELARVLSQGFAALEAAVKNEGKKTRATVREETASMRADFASLREEVRGKSLWEKLQAKRTARLEDEEVDEKLRFYVPVQATQDGLGHSARHGLDEYVDEFLGGKEQSLLIQGPSGMGKTTFSLYLERKLWQLCRVESNFIPFYIPLARYLGKPGEMMKRYCEDLGLTAEEITTLKKDYRVVLILDGYDETGCDKPLYLIERLHEWNGKVVTTCRNDYVMRMKGDSRKRFCPVRRGQPEMTLLTERYVQPFVQSQIEAYLRLYIALNEPLWSELSQYQNMIKRLPALASLVTNPFMLSVAADVLPVLDEEKRRKCETFSEVTEEQLLEKFVSRWFERQEMKLMERGELDYGDEYAEAFWSYAERLAARMGELGLDSVEITSANESEWEAFFGRDKKTRLLRSACPLYGEGTSRFSFIHPKVQSYLAGRNSLKKENDEIYTDSNSSSESSSDESSSDDWKPKLEQAILQNDEAGLRTFSVDQLTDTIEGGKHALGYACASRQGVTKKTIKLLISLLGNKAISEIMHADNNGYTPLHALCVNDMAPAGMIKELLQVLNTRAADAIVQTTKSDRYTVLHQACGGCDLETITLIVQTLGLNAKRILEARSNDGYLPQDLLGENENMECRRLRLEDLLPKASSKSAQVVREEIISNWEEKLKNAILENDHAMLRKFSLRQLTGAIMTVKNSDGVVTSVSALNYAVSEFGYKGEKHVNVETIRVILTLLGDKKTDESAKVGLMGRTALMHACGRAGKTPEVVSLILQALGNRASEVALKVDDEKKNLLHHLLNCKHHLVYEDLSCKDKKQLEPTADADAIRLILPVLGASAKKLALSTDKYNRTPISHALQFEHPTPAALKLIFDEVGFNGLVNELLRDQDTSFTTNTPMKNLCNSCEDPEVIKAVFAALGMVAARELARIEGNNCTAFYFLCGNEYATPQLMEQVLKLLGSQVNYLITNKCSSSLETALHAAGRRAHPDSVEHLLTALGSGASAAIAITNSCNASALHEACQRGGANGAKVIDLLVKKLGARAAGVISAVDTGKNNCLHLVCRYGTADAIKSILDALGEAAEQVLLVSDKKGRTPAEVLSYYRDKEINSMSSIIGKNKFGNQMIQKAKKSKEEASVASAEIHKQVMQGGGYGRFLSGMNVNRGAGGTSGASSSSSTRAFDLNEIDFTQFSFSGLGQGKKKYGGK